jgi:hypothetical protein
MELKPGTRLKSAACSAEVVIVRPPKTQVVLECGGHPMIAFSADMPVGLAISPRHAAGIHMGKRYFDAETGLEALASKAGAGSLSLNGRALPVKEAKALPSSD